MQVDYTNKIHSNKMFSRMKIKSNVSLKKLSNNYKTFVFSAMVWSAKLSSKPFFVHEQKQNLMYFSTFSSFTWVRAFIAFPFNLFTLRLAHFPCNSYLRLLLIFIRDTKCAFNKKNSTESRISKCQAFMNFKLLITEEKK